MLGKQQLQKKTYLVIVRQTAATEKHVWSLKENLTMYFSPCVERVADVWTHGELLMYVGVSVTVLPPAHLNL